MDAGGTGYHPACTAHFAVYSTLIAFQQTHGAFTSRVACLGKLRLVQEEETSGRVADKKRRREDACRATVISGYARQNNNLERAAEVNHSCSDLCHGRDTTNENRRQRRSGRRGPPWHTTAVEHRAFPRQPHPLVAPPFDLLHSLCRDDSRATRRLDSADEPARAHERREARDVACGHESPEVLPPADVLNWVWSGQW